MKTETLAYLGAIAIILALLAAVVVLLVTHTLTLEQVGPFLLALIVPITAIASLPIFKAALNAPSPEQSQQLQQLHSQSIQALASAAQPAPAQPANAPVPVAPTQ